MTSKERVLERYPQARAVKLDGANVWHILAIGIGTLGSANRRESWAWADAWRRLNEVE